MSAPRTNPGTRQVLADAPDPRDRVFPPDTDEYDRFQQAKAEGDRVNLKDEFENVDLAPSWTCDGYEELADHAWTQWGHECTGFALSSIADYHLREPYRNHSGGSYGAARPKADRPWPAADSTDPDDLAVREQHTVSRRMMYEMGQRYDRETWAEGSTTRGALKGWNLLGVARDSVWPYAAHDEEGEKHGKLTLRRVLDAVGTPGGAYLRIEKNNITDMKKSLALNYPLFVNGQTHVGWIDLYLPGRSVIEADDRKVGGHAFVIVGYDERGWRIHNSWGTEWGDGGYAVLPYEDFAENGQDVWFVFPPRRRNKLELTDEALLPTPPPPTIAADMWLHVIKIGDDGRLMPLGTPYGMDEERLKTMLFLFRQQTREWSTRRLAIFADGGYWNTETTLRQLGPLRDELMRQEIYPIFLVWDTPWLAETQGWLYGCTGETPDNRDADRINSLAYGDVDGPDEMIREIVEFMQMMYKFAAVEFGSREIWDQLRVRAEAACCFEDGAARLLAKTVAYNRTKADFELHLISHGAGDLLLSRLATLLPAPIATCNLWAPATTMDDFRATYGPMAEAGYVRHINVAALSTDAELADMMGPIPGSVLQLVSDVLAVDDLDEHTALLKVQDDPEQYAWQPMPRPVLGLQTSLESDDEIDRHRRAKRLDIEIFDGTTHVGLETDDRVHRATIDAVLAQRAAAPLPPPWLPPLTPRHDGPPAPADDPLDWWLAPDER